MPGVSDSSRATSEDELMPPLELGLKQLEAVAEKRLGVCRGERMLRKECVFFWSW